VRVNSSGDLVVQSSGSPTGPFIGPEGQDPFWTTGIFRWDLFGSGAGIDITVAPELPETSDPDTVPFTTAYYFPGTEAPPADHILTLPLQMVHYNGQILRILTPGLPWLAKPPLAHRFHPETPQHFHPDIMR
jgi:hypothetical protein